MLTLLDIGARDGLHARWSGLPVKGYGIEADAAECTRLNAQSINGFRFLPYAVGGKDGEARTFYRTVGAGCSSLLEPNFDALRAFPAGKLFAVKERLPITTTSLDTICRAESIQPDVLKLDTQGTELEILRGAPCVLARVLAVEIEVEFIELYRGQPLFRHIDAFMAEQGFTLLGQRRDLWRRTGASPSPFGGQLAHGDALYVHETRLAKCPDEAKVIWKAYKQHDQLTDVQPPRVWERVMGYLMRHAPLIGAPHRVWRYRLDRLCHPSVTDWHDVDEFF